MEIRVVLITSIILWGKYDLVHLTIIEIKQQVWTFQG